MLIDITQEPAYVEVSYVQPDGQIALEKLPLSVNGYQNWTITDENDPDKNLEKRNYDGQPVKLVTGKRFEGYGLIEFITKQQPQEVLDRLHAYDKPNFYSVDIETEILDEMPSAEEAKTRILSISITAPNMATVVLTLKPIADIERINEIVSKHVAKFSKQYQFPVKVFDFENERSMIEYFLHKVNTTFHVHGGWNYDGYDWLYITNRCKRLKIDIAMSSPVGKVNKRTSKPVHRFVIDYMLSYKAASRGTYLSSFSLNSISDFELGIPKLDYDETLKELYENDYDRFIAYNAIDTILVQLIHQKSNKLDMLFNMAYYTKAQVAVVHGKIAQADALIFEEFWKNGLVYADPPREIERQQYPGGYVKEPVEHECDFPVGYDAAALYPSTQRTFNIGPDSWMGKAKSKLEEEKYRAEGYFVSHRGIIYKNDKPYLYKRIQTGLKKERGTYKTYKARIFSELMQHVEQAANARNIHLDSIMSYN